MHRTKYENRATSGPLVLPFRTLMLKKILKELDRSSEHLSYGSAAGGFHISGNGSLKW